MNSLDLARRIRIDAVKMSHFGHASHIGSALSMADVIAVLYSDVLHYDPKNPKAEDRDRLVLSKGHASASLYSALAEVGFFDKEILWTYCQNDSMLSGHISHKVPGIELSTGSLGHGIGVATGFAMSAKKSNKGWRSYCIIGDGECDEGTIWEAALFANNYQLNNLTVICDHNQIQALGRCEDTMKLLDLRKKWEDFGWDAREIDGHDHEALKKNLLSPNPTKPNIIIADTIKGKGVSFMEGELLWHYRDPQGEFYVKAMEELGGNSDEK